MDWLTPPVVISVCGALVTVAAAFATFGTKLERLGKEMDQINEQLKTDKPDQLKLDRLGKELDQLKLDSINRREFDSFKEVIKTQYDNLLLGQGRVEHLFSDILKSVLEDRRS